LNQVTLAVLGVAGLTTLWLVYFVQFYLPNKLEQRVLESMKAFSRAIELRFPMHKGFTKDVIDLARLLGKRFGYSRSELHELELAAHLRDIGCCALPYRPYNEKERRDWSEAEKETYNRHPEVSGAMLELVPSLRHVAAAVRWHHSWFDGSDSIGNPKGLELPLNARILKVASDFIWNEQEVGTRAAARAIENGSGTEYCPEVVVEFMQVLTSSRAKEPEPTLVGL